MFLQKGSLNTKLMGELGIERKNQLRICRHLNEPTLAECVPNANRFEFVSDWLNALQLLDYLGCFSRANLTSMRDLIAANLSRGDLEVNFDLILKILKTIFHLGF